MIDLRVDIQGLAEVTAFVGGIQARLADLGPGLDLVHERFLEGRRRDFASQGRTTRRGSWKALKSSTVKAKGNSRVLDKSGRLRRSLTQANHPDHVYRRTSRKILAMGTRVPYAQYHQAGGGKLPQRRPVDPPPDEFDDYAEILAIFVVEGERQRDRRRRARR